MVGTIACRTIEDVDVRESIDHRVTTNEACNEAWLSTCRNTAG